MANAKVQSGQRLCQPFIIADKAAEACHPTETALDHPATRQQHEAALGRGQLDDFETDAMLLSRGSSLVAGVALVDERDFDRVTCHLLDLLGQFADLRSVLLVGRC